PKTALCGCRAHRSGSVPRAVIVGVLDVEETLGVAVKACATTMNVAAIGARAWERLEIVAADEDALDGAVVRGVVDEGALAGGFQSRPAVGVGQAQRALGAAQSLDDAIAEQLLDERAATRADRGGLL